MNTYTFKVNSTGVWTFIFTCLPTAFLILTSFAFSEIIFLQIILIIIGLKIGFYSSIDYLFKKQLVKTEQGSLLLKSFGITFDITLDLSFLIIDEDMISLNNYSKKSYGLYIVRNNRFWINRLFKNRIKLITDSKNYNIVQIMETVANDFGLRYVDMRNV